MEALKQRNNKGYTLVELIVTILITGMITIIITVFISVSRTTYEEVREESVLQQEAAMAGSYIEDIAVEAYEYGMGQFTTSEGNYKILNIKAPDSDYVSGVRYNYYYIILWEEGTQTLRFCKVKDDAIKQENGTYLLPVDSGLKYITATNILDYKTMLSAGNLNIINNQKALLARHVTDMEIILPNPTTNSKLAKITFRFRYHNKEYVCTKSIMGRNID